MGVMSDDAIRNILDAVKTGGVSILTDTKASGSGVTFKTPQGKKIRAQSKEETAPQEDVHDETPSSLHVDPAELKPVTF